MLQVSACCLEGLLPPRAEPCTPVQPPTGQSLVRKLGATAQEEAEGHLGWRGSGQCGCTFYPTSGSPLKELSGFLLVLDLGSKQLPGTKVLRNRRKSQQEVWQTEELMPGPGVFCIPAVPCLPPHTAFSCALLLPFPFSPLQALTGFCAVSLLPRFSPSALHLCLSQPISGLFNSL